MFNTSWEFLVIFTRFCRNSPIYKDYTQSFEDRVDDLLSRMTLAEKASQMMSRSPNDLIKVWNSKI